MDAPFPQAIHEEKTPSPPSQASSDADDVRVVLLHLQHQGPKSDADAAFARLYDRHAPVVLALCRQHTRATGGNDADADDALQETFLRAYRMLDRLDNSAAIIRPWLYAIARNVCSEKRRSAHRRSAHENTARQLAMPALLNHTPSHDSSSTPPRTGASPTHAAAHTEQLFRLSRALDQLSDSERLAVHLYYLDKDPVTAASTALGVSRSGYYKLLASARARLAVIMQDASPRTEAAS